MQVIDNWAIVSGEVREVRAAADHTTLVVYVSSAEDFEDFPNLFNWAKNNLLTVELPADAHAPNIGAHISWRLRIVEPGSSEPHPSSLAV
ncbi:MAG: hypothetical protein GC165_04065 [Armatimonadetes bacterium]|nr:hypothetical protein [Armatimonadota bacterium]MBS1727527.1 hypothetical protein [Armatimonadota bacterium]